MSITKILKNSKKTKEKQRNDVIDIFTSEDMKNMWLNVVSYEIYEWHTLQ